MRMLRLEDSSNVSEIGYDRSAKLLRLRFHSGGLYEYADVGPSTFVDMATAESVGKYFGQHIKGKYSFTTIEQKPKTESFEKRARSALRLIASIKQTSSEQVGTVLEGCVAAAQEALEDS